MQRRKYSVIVFDLGNVLIPFDYNILINKLDKIKTGLGKHFVDTYNRNYHIHKNFECGKITEEEFISKMLDILEHSIDRETFCEYFSGVFSTNDKVIEMLPGLKEKYKLILLSNTNSIHERYGWKHYPFLKYFDDLILSHKIGSIKPEEKIYHAVEKASGKPPGEHIFIDDIEEYVNAAKKLGWDGIHFSNEQRLMEELKRKQIL